MSTIKIQNKSFKKYIQTDKLQKRILEISEMLNKSLQNEDVIFIVILNGAFFFGTDLLRNISIPCQVSFLKLASYEDTGTTGNVKRLIGLNEKIANKTVVIIEDIVDSGNTIEDITEQLEQQMPKKILITTLFFKPKAYKKRIQLNYIGFEIPEYFIIGYGLDYNGYGRNLNDIYVEDIE